MKIIDTPTNKYLDSEDLHYMFNKQTGYTMLWGKTMQDDPVYSKYGPIILDVEISEICHKGCAFCYKGNTRKGKNMSLDTFKKVFDKLPKTLTQIAFGIGDIDSNPDMFPIFQYCRNYAVIPNVTINGSRMTDFYYNNLVSLCGAVAVSFYGEESLDAVYELTKRGLTQTNIHMMLSQETLSRIVELLDKVETDHRLANLNAIVFLGLKQKGRGEHFTPVTNQQFENLMEYLFENNIRFGFDSCSANKVINYIKKYNLNEKLIDLCEPCESMLFSGYCDVEGKFYPCSFVTEPYFKGIDLLEDGVDFMKDVWYNPTMVEWREKLLQCGRSCPVYKV